jgi:hypothetical protein
VTHCCAFFGGSGALARHLNKREHDGFSVSDVSITTVTESPNTLGLYAYWFETAKTVEFPRDEQGNIIDMAARKEVDDDEDFLASGPIMVDDVDEAILRDEDF